MVRTACAQVDAWNRQRRVAGLPELYVSVNCSARQLLHPGCAGRLAEILRDSGTDPSALVIELTGSVMGAASRGPLRACSPWRTRVYGWRWGRGARAVVISPLSGRPVGERGWGSGVPAADLSTFPCTSARRLQFVCN